MMIHKNKTIPLLLFILVLLSLFLVACARDGGDDSVIYRSDLVSVTAIDADAERAYADFSFVPLTDEIAYGDHLVVLKGTVSNVREVVIRYEFMDTECADQNTLFDLTVTETVASSSSTYQDGVPANTTVTVGVSFNRTLYAPEFTIPEEGKEYLIFCRVLDEWECTREEDQFADLWCIYPNGLFCESVGDRYLTTEYFGALSSHSSILREAGLDEDDTAALAAEKIGSASFDEQLRVLSKSDASADALNAVRSLKVRARENASMLRSLMEKSYLIDETALETYIADAFASKSAE